MSIVTALVVVVCGLIFLVDTVLHVSSPAARTWSVAFLAGILTVVCYLAWTLAAGAWVAAGVGNAAFVTTTGFMWLGARRYNRGGRLRMSYAVVIVLALATLVATLVQGADGGDWAGATVMFVALGVLAGLGAAEARRRPLRDRPASIGLTIVLLVQCLFYLARTPVFLVRGPDSDVFQSWFGTSATSLITIWLTITAVVVISILRATERGQPMAKPHTVLELSADGFLDGDSFRRVLVSFLARAQEQGERVAVVYLRVEDMAAISMAFGAHTAKELTGIVRQAVQNSAPVSAFLGSDDSPLMMVGVPGATTTDIERTANRLAQRVIDCLNAEPSGITPVLGVGAALGERPECRADDLLAAAERAAQESASQLEASVVVEVVPCEPPQRAVSR